MEEKKKSGKREHQKLKSYLVLQILLRETDENHTLKAPEIAAKLELMGIEAERRSLYRDIDEINLVLYMLENGLTVEEAEEELADPEFAESCKVIAYDPKSKGFYARPRRYTVNEIRLLAECIYSAKFLTEKKAKQLADVVCDFVSDYEAETIRHDALLTDRVKTNNDNVISNINTINAAMSKTLEGKKHIPEKISFKYLKASVNNVSKQVERRKGELYIVSPYKLLINDGNYYLLAFEEESQDMRTYRVDRMKDVHPKGEPREGKEAFDAIDLQDYTKRAFSMFGGETQRVEMRFINPLLDAVIDRFGTSGARYFSEDERHFTVSAEVDISDQFFGWLLGFGKRVKLLGPQAVVDQFATYLDKIREMY